MTCEHSFSCLTHAPIVPYAFFQRNVQNSHRPLIPPRILIPIQERPSGGLGERPRREAWLGPNVADGAACGCLNSPTSGDIFWYVSPACSMLPPSTVIQDTCLALTCAVLLWQIVSAASAAQAISDVPHVDRDLHEACKVRLSDSARAHGHSESTQAGLAWERLLSFPHCAHRTRSFVPRARAELSNMVTERCAAVAPGARFEHARRVATFGCWHSAFASIRSTARDMPSPPGREPPRRPTDSSAFGAESPWLAGRETSGSTVVAKLLLSLRY